MKVLIVLIAAVALVGCGDGESGERQPEGATLPLTFEHSYGGVAGGMAQLRLEADGSGQLEGGPYGNGCGSEGEIGVQLTADELRRLRDLLGSASSVSPRVREEPATESPAYGLTAGDLELRYEGFDVVPEEARPLFGELDRLVNDHCLKVNP